jgi:transposase
VSSRRSITSVAKELGLCDSVPRRSVDKVGSGGHRRRGAPPRKRRRRTKLRTSPLRQENERLRMERDIVKNCPGPWHACAG